MIYCILNPSEKIKTHMIENIGNCTTDDKIISCGIKIMMMENKMVREPDVIVLFNGVLYNRIRLCQILNIPPETSCETVIIKLYKKYGLDYILKLLKGVYNFILFDYYYENEISKVYVVKDAFGIVPLHIYIYSHSKHRKNSVLFTSKKSENNQFFEKEWKYVDVENGTYSKYELSSKVSAEWTFQRTAKHYILPNTNIDNLFDFLQKNNTQNKYKEILQKIVKKICGPDINQTECDSLSNQLLEKFYCHSVDENVYYCSETQEKPIIFSTKNPFYYEPTETQLQNPKNSEQTDGSVDVLEIDKQIRKKLMSTQEEFDPSKKYVFYDEDFIQGIQGTYGSLVRTLP